MRKLLATHATALLSLLGLLAGSAAAAALLGANPHNLYLSAATSAKKFTQCPEGYRPVSGEKESQAPHFDGPVLCQNSKHPEPLFELAAGAEQRLAMAAAPRNQIPKGSYIKAIKQRNAIAAAGQSSQARGKWTLYGKGSLDSDVAEYTSVAGYGLENVAGRITNFFYIPPGDKNLGDDVLASVAYGGVWRSQDHGQSWASIGEKLPSQVVGAVGYTKAGGGTIVALTGDGSFGRYSRSGAGAFYTTNLGRSWKRAKGLPSDAFGFKIAVDKAHPKRVYAATGAGLYRSADAGRRFVNVKLPVSDKCAGKSVRVKGCLLANMITDVVIKEPGGSTDEAGGQVLAAVGWRGGNRENPNGSVQSPGNGLYVSEKGKPGSFTKLEPTGFAEQDRIGRVELGPAIGKDQDHNYIYAMVQDAILLRGGTPGLDTEGGGPPPANVPTVFNGVYASSDFGQTWTLMASAEELQEPSSGSALTGVAQSSGYGPGIQSWYNEWIAPDPTRQAGGIPTRLLFGLEEVWMNEETNTPQTGKSKFRVIGRYYAGSSCVFVQAGLPACPAERDNPTVQDTTTHPDQQAGIMIPVSVGNDVGSILVVGNDGGAYHQQADPGTDFSNEGWGDGAQTGFNTLLPYDAVIAKDGIAYSGLQDNGTMKIDNGKQIEVYGGDGFFVGVDPHNSKRAYEEYVYGSMSATKDGGKTWTAMSPPGLDGTTAQFSTPFAVDPVDFDHLMIAGDTVDETGSGPGTSSSDWAVVYDLGTQKHPGDKDAEPADDDPVNSMTGIDLYKENAYIGYCGVCSTLDASASFKSGIATNVGGSKPPQRYKSAGWHIAKTRGLPDRYVTSIAMEHKAPKNVLVGLGGYSARWVLPNSVDKNANVGKGHLFFSSDVGKTFKDVSGNLPNTPVNWVTMRGKQVLVATDVGVFITKPGTNCHRACKFEVLGKGLPSSPVFTTRVAVCDKNLITAAVYGRGVYTYRLGPKPPCPEPKVPPPPPFKGEKVAGPFDFETDAEGWEATSTSDTSAWKLAPPGHESAQSFQDVPYTDETSAALVSPKLELPERSSVKVSWFERYDTEPCCDYFSVEWSSDGKVWNAANAVAGQNADFPNFSAAEVTFVAPAGDLYIRFRLASDALVSAPAYSGAAIDKILIER